MKKFKKICKIYKKFLKMNQKLKIIGKFMKIV